MTPGGASAGALDSDWGRRVSETFPRLAGLCRLLAELLVEEADWRGSSDGDGSNNSSPWSLRAYCAQRSPCGHLGAGEGVTNAGLVATFAGRCWKLHPPMRPCLHASIHPLTHSTRIWYYLLCARPRGFSG